MSSSSNHSRQTRLAENIVCNLLSSSFGLSDRTATISTIGNGDAFLILSILVARCLPHPILYLEVPEACMRYTHLLDILLPAASSAAGRSYKTAPSRALILVYFPFTRASKTSGRCLCIHLSLAALVDPVGADLRPDLTSPVVFEPTGLPGFPETASPSAINLSSSSLVIASGSLPAPAGMRQGHFLRNCLADFKEIG